MNYVLLIVGFVILIKCADWFVDGSVIISEKFGVPSLIIGLTIVAMGTSAPEAAVSVTAAIDGSNGIAIGNVVGSNIFNLLMVLGIAAIIKPLPINDRALKVDYPISIGATILVGVLALNHVLGRIDGIVLLAAFAAFIAMTIITAKKKAGAKFDEASENPPNAPNMKKGVILLIIGIAGIIGGGKLVVYSASNIAASFGVSDTLIGLTIVAIGTSLPELVTSAVAARKGEIDIAVGNVVGSNIFNLLFVLPLSTVVHPISIGFESVADCGVLLLVSVIALIPLLTRRKVNLPWGVILIALYVGYTIYILMR